MLKPSIAAILGLERSTNPTRDVAACLPNVFDYVSDPDRLGVSDNWPSRQEIADNFAASAGRLRDDCDGYAFAAAYALHDLGVGARVVIGICETGDGHMVCEDEHGSVIDNRYPGRVLTWTELERIGYRSARMNALDFEDRPQDWHFVKIGADGLRDYS